MISICEPGTDPSDATDGADLGTRKLGTDPPCDPRRALRRTARSLSPHPTPSPQSQEEEPRAGRFADRRTQPSAHEAKHDRPPTRDVHVVHYSVREARVHMPSCWCSIGGPHGSRGARGVGRVTGDTDGAVLGTSGAVMGVYPLGVSPADPPARWRGRRSCLRGWRQCERPGHHRPVCDLEG
jgi:hypothetical protein